ncbi:MAG: hypothetical protein NTY41_19080, partial [Proteobacteria bacterium]|nr:hypothetical protein [Pseudomonadota bacterium]
GTSGEPGDGVGIGSTHVGRGDNPHWHTASGEDFKRRLKQAQASPLDESDKDINPVGGSHFLAQLVFELRVAAGAGE